MKGYLGIDGGGTKTQFLLADAEGHLLAAERLGGIDFTQIGMDGVQAVLEEGRASILRQAAARTGPVDITALCAGLTLISEYQSWDEHCPRLLAAVFPGVSIRCVNDSIIALYGSLALKPGIHLVAGTGSIVSGRDPTGATARCGGWNEFFSDEGSCYWLGHKACEIFARQADGRLKRGPLYDILRRHLGLRRDFDLIGYYHDNLQGCREKIAALQIILAQAAAAGDSAALSAYADAARELSLMVKAVRSRLAYGVAEVVAVSCTGGLFRAGDLIRKPLQNQLPDDQFLLSEPCFSPAAGAILGAYEQGGLNEKQIAAIMPTLKKEDQAHDFH
ncbi:MAG: BadF/BadG/BcrA/BcrD ATPase family protein [Clostridiaceae bacterium]|nr:BadF/BadG/BcrA/BcrD ATPase family protein [Clostridiaceae bacterium]